MQDRKIKYDEIDAIFAVSHFNLTWNLLNGEWKYAPNQMSYQGYSTTERMCEIISGDREWEMDASGQST